jgi:hypothetical protein
LRAGAEPAPAEYDDPPPSRIGLGTLRSRRPDGARGAVQILDVGFDGELGEMGV